MTNRTKCQRCGSDRIMDVTGKVSDMFCGKWRIKEPVDKVTILRYRGYVPNLPIGSGDYIEFQFCLGCGQIQGKFPAQFSPNGQWKKD